ncbi:MAG: 3-phosphoserine/phosphohydroxythreonine transaminase [Anaerolineales bacterium]|nr:3-phosphoserine/phosphohydroxythreonine transaminase [Anaerolineales bacterium]
MKTRVHNFNAGPAALPLAVLEKAQAELLDYHGLGMSILEMSHRSAAFDDLMTQVDEDLRQLMGIPNNYKILFLQGGASLQFDMLPMNLLPKDVSADYLVNGVWGEKAVQEARKLGNTRVAASSEETNFDRLPNLSQADFDPRAAYLHFTSNETIHGNQWAETPKPPPGVPLVCDMSSDILSRPVEISKYGLIYAGAQKNAGPSGVTLVIIRDDLLERIPQNLPAMLDYRLLAEKGSLYNTPPSFSIYMLGLVLNWLLGLGGLKEIAKLNAKKADLVYQAIDQSDGYYRGYAQPECRSLMNVTFRLASTGLENSFVEAAAKEGLIGLKGHRSVGGLRASIYNACPVEAVEALVEFMADFHCRQGKVGRT